MLAKRERNKLDIFSTSLLTGLGHAWLKKIVSCAGVLAYGEPNACGFLAVKNRDGILCMKIEAGNFSFGYETINPEADLATHEVITMSNMKLRQTFTTPESLANVPASVMGHGQTVAFMNSHSNFTFKLNEAVAVCALATIWIMSHFYGYEDDPRALMHKRAIEEVDKIIAMIGADDNPKIKHLCAMVFKGQ